MPSPSTAPADLLAALAAVLSRLRVPWYVFGAQAALVWGRPRLTADVDVTVRLESDDWQALVRALEAAGFQLRTTAGDDFVRRTRVLPFVYLPNGLPLDVVLGGPGLEELFLERAIPVAMGSATVPVMCAEDVIVTKILAGRTKDLDDARGILLRRLEDLDVDLIRSTLAMLEDALSRSDLLPVLESEIAGVLRIRASSVRAHRRRARKSTEAFLRTHPPRADRKA